MSVQGATQAVGAGIATATVVAALPASYQLSITTSWSTEFDGITKTATGFVVNFSVPAPAGGGTFDWTAFASGLIATVGGGLASSATVAVAGGATAATVPVSFGGAAFQLGITTGWLTDFQVLKSTNGFTVQFATAAPAGGSTFDWVATSTGSLVNGTPTAPLANATQTVLAAAGQDTLIAPIGNTAFQVTIAPSWVTSYSVTAKTAGGFVVTFGTPAPPGGGSYDWVVWSPGSGILALSDLLTDLRDLLRDPNDDLWSQAQKIRFLNKALVRRDEDTEANRTLISLVLTAGTDTYSFANLGNSRVFDVIGINLIFVAERVVLKHLSFTELNQQFRPWVPWTDIPRAFARYGPQQVIFGPSPGFAYTTEWDCAVYSNPLVNLTDTDVLPVPYTQPVPFYAAHLAKLNERQWDEADDFFRQYREQIDTAISARVGMDPQVARI